MFLGVMDQGVEGLALQQGERVGDVDRRGRLQHIRLCERASGRVGLGGRHGCDSTIK